MSRLVATILVDFQRFSLTTGNSTRHKARQREAAEGMSRANKAVDAMAALALKGELDAALTGSGELARNNEWGNAERKLLQRWADEWTDSPDHAPLWAAIAADARKLGGYRTNAGMIFQELIFYTVSTWQIAKAVESGDDPIQQQIQNRRDDHLDLPKAADALAKHY